MSDLRSLNDVRYYDQQMRATRKLLDHVVEAAALWDQMPSYERYGKLEYFSMLPSWLSGIRIGYESGRLTDRQVREFRNLQRLAETATGTIKILHERYEEDERRETGQDIGPLARDQMHLQRCYECDRYSPMTQSHLTRRRDDDPDVEEEYFLCPYCGHEHIYRRTNSEIRAIEVEQRRRGCVGYYTEEICHQLVKRKHEIEAELNRRFDADPEPEEENDE